MAAVPETVAQAAISPDVAPSDVAASTLVTAWPADVTSLDPANLSTSQDHELTRNIYQTLSSAEVRAREQAGPSSTRAPRSCPNWHSPGR